MTSCDQKHLCSGAGDGDERRVCMKSSLLSGHLERLPTPFTKVMRTDPTVNGASQAPEMN